MSEAHLTMGAHSASSDRKAPPICDAFQKVRDVAIHDGGRDDVRRMCSGLRILAQRHSRLAHGRSIA